MEVTLLAKEQIFGEKRLKIFDEYGTKAATTDFAILLGGDVRDNYYYNNGNLLEDRTGWYWTSSSDNYNNVRVVYSDGNSDTTLASVRSGGARPTLPYSLISRSCTNVVKGHDGILEVEYGEYPQRVAPKTLQDELENAYQNKQNSIRKTGKAYTTDSRRWYALDIEFSARKHEEFEYNERKYIRFIGDFNASEEVLSDGSNVEMGTPYWIEVSPIKWLVDIEKDMALSERILFAGIQFDDKEKYDGNFKKTFMYKYLNTIFIKDIQVQPKEIEISVIEEKSKRELELEKLEKDKQKILNLKRNIIK